MNDLVERMNQAWLKSALESHDPLVRMTAAAKVLLDAQTDWEEDSARAAAMNSLEAENVRLRTENAALKRPVSASELDEYGSPMGNGSIGFYMNDVSDMITSRSKGEANADSPKS